MENGRGGGCEFGKDLLVRGGKMTFKWDIGLFIYKLLVFEKGQTDRQPDIFFVNLGKQGNKTVN